MTPRTIVCAAVALLVSLIPASAAAAVNVTALQVSPGACGSFIGADCADVPAGQAVTVTCAAAGSGLLSKPSVQSFSIAVSGGTLEGGLTSAVVNVTPAVTASASLQWTTPVGAPDATVSCTATATGPQVSPTVAVKALLVAAAAPPPVVSAFVFPAGPVVSGAEVPLGVTASDPQGGALTYLWEVSGGSLAGQGTAATTWTAPDGAGPVTVKVTVTNASGGVAVRSATVEVALSVFQGQLPAAMRLPRRVSATAAGDLAVADGAGRLLLLTRLGGLRGAPALSEPVVAVAGADGVVYASTSKGSILKVDVETGRLLARYRLGVAQGPSGLAWDAARNLLWMAHRASGLVQAIRPDGSTAVVLAQAGAASLADVSDVAVDASTGTIWVAQDANQDGPLVHAFAGDGTYLRSMVAQGGGAGQVLRAGGLAAAGGKVYVSDAFNGTVQVLAADGTPVGALGAFGTGAGQLRQPAGLAVLASGDLVVANMDAGRLDRFGRGVAMATCAADDADCDGLPDAWELANGLNPADPSDALADSDGDGLTNVEEWRHGTNPRLADTDGDGVSDKDELLAGFDPLDGTDHLATLAASGPGRTGPGLVRVAGVAAGAGSCATTWLQTQGPAVVLRDPASPSPSFIARAAGTYVLEGRATCGKSAATRVTSVPVTVSVDVDNAAPVADAGRLAVVTTGDRVDLSAAGSSDANGDALAFAWEQVAGPSTATTASGAALSARTLRPGYHAFKVTARDPRGLAGEAEVPVIVVEPAVAVPTAAAVQAVLRGEVGVPVHLEAVSYGGTAFSWEQVAGPLASGLDATAAAPVFTPTAPGRHAFRVTAWNGELRSAPETVEVYVADGGTALPLATATGPAVATVNAPVSLDGRGSTPGAGGPLAWRWRQVSGPAAGLTEADRAAATVVAFSPGWYEFELAVAEGSAVGLPVRVGFAALAGNKPLPVASGAAFPAGAVVGQPVRLDGRGSGGAKRFRWTQVAGPWVPLQAAVASQAFVPPSPGQYVFEVEVDDGVARSKPFPVSVLVSPEVK